MNIQTVLLQALGSSSSSSSATATTSSSSSSSSSSSQSQSSLSSKQKQFTPAPVEYTPHDSLPTYSSSSLPSSGPVTASKLSSTAPKDTPCQTINDILSSIPEASQWLQLLRNAGLDSVLLNDPNVQTTLFVPINSAFTAGIDLEPLRSEKTMQELIANAPDLLSPLAGYSVVKGLWPSSALTAGTQLQTSDTIDKVNPLTIKAISPNQLQGIGNSARILQADIAACGPSVVHIIDQILLPFDLSSQTATDAIKGTEVNNNSSG